MAELDSMTVVEDSSSEKRQWLSSTKFWVIAFLLHMVFLALLTQIGWVIRTSRTLIGMNIAEIPEGVDISVAIPGAPPGPGLAGPPTPDIKVPLAGQPAAAPDNMDANPAPDLSAVAAAISTTGPSGFSLPGRVAAGIPGALTGLPGTGRGFGQGGTGDKIAGLGVWKNRFAKDKAKFSDRITEEAVMKALRWLKDNQQDDGSWLGAKNSDVPKWNQRQAPVAMTGLALLAFLAHGETPTSREFGSTVQRGINWLSAQAEKGRAGSSVEYETGIAAYALAEAYGMTGDGSLREVVEKCVDTIIAGQTKGGGWEYSYGKTSEYGDMSISSWQIQALKSAYVAGVKREEVTNTLDKAMEYAKKVYSSHGGATDKGGFGYKRPGAVDWSLTGNGLLCLLFWHQGNSREAAGAAKFICEEIPFGLGKDRTQTATARHGGYSGTDSLYAYYYVTQAAFMFDGPNGPTWRYWSEQFNDPKESDPKKRALIGTQKEDGSFPIGDWTGGPVYNTALSALMLEVYYRNLPSTQ